MRLSRRAAWPLGLVLALVLLHAQWLPVLAWILICAEAPRRADAIFVLGGDQYGERILHAAALARQGYAPKVYVSGPSGIFDHYESDLSIEFARRRGYTDVTFLALENDCKSTRDEAERYLPEFRRLGFKRILVVTSNFHTRRAGRIFRAVAQEPEIHMMAAAAREFRPADWWLRRQDQKNLFMEWSKTFANWIGL
ncbi:MAG: YdcF family protein [Acidobacteriaceae bacterium]|nr:YdcF family protein [Acidobacteriaceae bacterium]